MTIKLKDTFPNEMYLNKLLIVERLSILFSQQHNLLK